MVANIRGYTPNYKFRLINFDTPRWHTLEYANWNMADALLLQSGIPQVRGGWQNNTAYLEGDRVFDEDTSATYRCLIAHTSALTGTFGEDRILHPAYWSLQLSGTPVFRDEWVSGVAYVLGDIVSVNDYTFYLCTMAHMSSVTFPPDALFWQEVFDAAQVVIDAEAAKDAAYQFSLDAQSSANDAQSSEEDAQLAEDAAKGWANDARAATGGFRWAYSSSTTAADPAVGRVAFNNANPLAITEIYLSAYNGEVGNPDVSDWVATWDDSTNVLTRGTLQVRKVGSPEQFMIFELKGNITDNGAWLLLPVAYITHSGSIINGEAISLGFVRAGNQGPTGTGGGDMLRANNLNDVVSIANSRTNLGLGTAQIPTFSQVLLGNQPSDPMHAATRGYVDSSPSLVVSDTAPNATTSLAGTLWWDSDLGTLFVLYDDGNSKQWVQATATPGIDTTPLVKKAGDTMTGDLTIAKVDPFITLNRAAVGQRAAIIGSVNGLTRWRMSFGNPAAESGGNVGSNFIISRYNDVGVGIDDPITIDRSTGMVSMLADPTVALGVATKQYVDARVLDVAAYSGMQINGSMEVSQELAGTARTTNGYIGDGYNALCTGTFTWNGATTPALMTPGFNNVSYISIGTAQATLNAGDYALMQHRIEGYRIARLAWGVASAKPVTVAFWSGNKPAGLYSVAITNSDGTRSYTTSYTQAVASQAQYNVVTIPGCIDGVWNKTNTIGMVLNFVLGSGSTFVTPTPNAWVNGNYTVIPGQVNGAAAAGNVLSISGVIVLPGTQAPTAAQSPLIMRPYDQELLTCQRYYQLIDVPMVGMNAGLPINSVIYGWVPYLAEMRSTPTVAIRTAPGLSNATANITSPTTKAIRYDVTATTSAPFYAVSAVLSADARL